MPYVPISTEARGRYRLWRAAVQRMSDCLDAVFDSEPFGVATGNFSERQGKGRRRALGHLRRFLEGAGARFIDFDGERARWSYLRPHPGEVVTMVIILGRENCGEHPWVLVFTDHALQRALQRATPGLDLTGLAWHAVESARRLSLEFLVTRTTPDRFRVTAGEGAFACDSSLIEIEGHEMPIVTARTWLAADEMSEIQEAQVVDDGDPGDRFDDSYEEFRKEWRLPPLTKYRTKHGWR